MSQTLDDIQHESGNVTFGEYPYLVHVNPMGHLIIRRNHSSRKFYLWTIPFFFISLASGLTSFVFIATGFDQDIGAVFGLLAGLISGGLVGIRLFFRLLKKVKWEFTGTELIIYNDLNFRKIIPRESITALSIEERKFFYGVSEHELNYWIVLHVPQNLYEDGNLYLIVVNGGNTVSLRAADADLSENVFGPGQTLILSETIAAHWNLPIL